MPGSSIRVRPKSKSVLPSVSSFSIIKGSLIDETRAAFRSWDLSRDKSENLGRLRDDPTWLVGSSNWRRDVVKVLSRRFDPAEQDRPLVLIARSSVRRESWASALLWHLTRGEFLLQAFLRDWLYEERRAGRVAIRTEDIDGFLGELAAGPRPDLLTWGSSTRRRVASGLLRMGCDFGLLQGKVTRRFAPFRLEDEALLYVLHALADHEPGGGRILASSRWRMFLLDEAEVEQRILVLHQFGRLNFEAAGSLVRLDLPYASSLGFAGSMEEAVP